MFKQFFYKRHIKKILASSLEPSVLARTLANELGILDKLSIFWPTITIRHKVELNTRYSNIAEFVRDLEQVREAVIDKSYLTKLSLPVRPSTVQPLYDWCQSPEGYNIELSIAVGYTRDLILEITGHLREYTESETAHCREYANYIRRKCEYVFSTANQLMKIGISLEKEQLWLLNR